MIFECEVEILRPYTVGAIWWSESNLEDHGNSGRRPTVVWEL